MSATREQRRQHHQIGQREQPLLGLCTRSLRRPGDHSQVTAPREVVYVLHADPRQTGDFRVGEDLLTRLYGDQGNLTISAAFISQSLRCSKELRRCTYLLQ